jgi:hypothetical protein
LDAQAQLIRVAATAIIGLSLRAVVSWDVFPTSLSTACTGLDFPIKNGWWLGLCGFKGG